MFKRLKVLLVSCLFVSSVSAAITPNPSAPTIAAKSYILQDFASGKIIAASNSEQDFRLPVLLN